MRAVCTGHTFSMVNLAIASWAIVYVSTSTLHATALAEPAQHTNFDGLLLHVLGLVIASG